MVDLLQIVEPQHPPGLDLVPWPGVISPVGSK